MGLLDDAIREHLDLKRRRGADPAEVERAEREALGPVRRVAEESPPNEREPDDVQLVHEPEGEVEYEDEEWEQDEQLEDELEPAPRPPVADQDEPVQPPADTIVDDAHSPAQPGRDEPFDHGDETAEYDVEGELEKDQPSRKAGEKGDDVLEETPDFLQDTPDHDRLWFEQRPPRDFDFDG